MPIFALSCALVASANTQDSTSAAKSANKLEPLRVQETVAKPESRSLVLMQKVEVTGSYVPRKKSKEGELNVTPSKVTVMDARFIARSGAADVAGLFRRVSNARR